MAEHHRDTEEMIRLCTEIDTVRAELNKTNADIVTVIRDKARLQAKLDMVNQELKDTNAMTKLLLQELPLNSAYRDPSLWDCLMSKDEEWLSLSSEMRSFIESKLRMREPKQTDDAHPVIHMPNQADRSEK